MFLESDLNLNLKQVKGELCGHPDRWKNICKGLPSGSLLAMFQEHTGEVKQEGTKWRWAQMGVYGRAGAGTCHRPVCRAEFPERCWVMEEPYNNLTWSIRHLHSWNTFWPLPIWIDYCLPHHTEGRAGHPVLTPLSSLSFPFTPHYPPLPTRALHPSSSRELQLSLNATLELDSRPIMRFS